MDKKILNFVNINFAIVDKCREGGGETRYPMFVDKMPFFKGPFPEPFFSGKKNQCTGRLAKLFVRVGVKFLQVCQEYDRTALVLLGGWRHGLGISDSDPRNLSSEKKPDPVSSWLHSVAAKQLASQPVSQSVS